MSTYLLVDLHNLLHRGRHATRASSDLQDGMAIHIVLSSIRWAWNKFNASHVVFCTEGRSWRRDVYGAYKANRAKVRESRSNDQVDEDKAFYETVDYFTTYLEEKTNCTVLQHPLCEADDLIAQWIREFDDGTNKFVIISSDSDFQQLLSDSVEIYDGVNKKHYSPEGIFNERGDVVKDKNGVPLEKIDPRFVLFEKCIRGDTSDNIPSAFPGVRSKGSKKSFGILDAYSEIDTQGYKWNNFMLSTWTDPFGNQHLVRDKYEQNKLLIDLTEQPEEIKAAMRELIHSTVNQPKQISGIGLHFMKFCGIYQLVRLSEMAKDFTRIFQAPIKKID